MVLVHLFLDLILDSNDGKKIMLTKIPLLYHGSWFFKTIPRIPGGTLHHLDHNSGSVEFWSAPNPNEGGGRCPALLQTLSPVTGRLL